MKYKNFEIVPVYSLCADWKLDKNDCVVPKRKSKKDIEYYQIIDNGRDWICENTIGECKHTIDRMLIILGTKVNTKD